MLHAMPGRLGNDHFTPFFVTLAHACPGDREAAVANLEETARTSNYLTVLIPCRPDSDRDRDAPDDLAFRARHGSTPPPH